VHTDPKRNDGAQAHLASLVACRSVTPHDDGALGYVADILAALGFSVTRKSFADTDTPDIDNVFATIGAGAPHLVFAGHTDVVPAGDETGWSQPPFSGTVADGMMFGRGTVDMKGGIACFLAAASRYLATNNTPAGTLSVLITGDEEGPAVNGTVKMLNWAIDAGHRFNAALIGEPTSQEWLGDTVKTGRRGSLSGVIEVRGRQGHVAYPHLADNPLPGLVTVMAALDGLRLDDGTADFPPTNLEFTSLEAGNTATNVIPAAARAAFNIRFNDSWSVATLQARIAEVVAGCGARNATVTWIRPVCDVFLTSDEGLLRPLSAAIEAVTGTPPNRSTAGGTSDGRFFKDHCAVAEFGLVGTTMHQIDEHVPVADLEVLTGVYADFLTRYFAEATA